MPSHASAKNAFIYPELSALAPFDVTELLDTDDLFVNHEDSATTEDEQTASKLFGSDYCLFSTCGATLCIQTAVMAAKRLGGKMLLDRFSHKSVFNAVALTNLDYEFIYHKNGVQSGICAEDIETKLNDDITSVFITSPNYYGICADYKNIESFIKKENLRRAKLGIQKLILIVDNSHGAHLKFIGKSLHPLDYSADIVTDSIHKTFGSFGSTAILHFNNNASMFFDKAAAKDMMKIFSTTSPSFLLLLSIENAILNPENTVDYHLFYEKIKVFRQKLSALDKINLISEKQYKNLDFSRLTLHSKYLTGDEIYDMLHKNNIVCEMSDEEYCVLIMSPYNSSEDELSNLYNVLKKINDNFCIAKPDKKTLLYPQIENVVLPLCEALTKSTAETAVSACENQICGEFVYQYPPGIPIAIPGQRLNKQLLQIFADIGYEKIKIIK